MEIERKNKQKNRYFGRNFYNISIWVVPFVFVHHSWKKKSFARNYWKFFSKVANTDLTLYPAKKGNPTQFCPIKIIIVPLKDCEYKKRLSSTVFAQIFLFMCLFVCMSTNAQRALTFWAKTGDWWRGSERKWNLRKEGPFQWIPCLRVLICTSPNETLDQGFRARTRQNATCLLRHPG